MCCVGKDIILLGTLSWGVNAYSASTRFVKKRRFRGLMSRDFCGVSNSEVLEKEAWNERGQTIAQIWKTEKKNHQQSCSKTHAEGLRMCVFLLCVAAPWSREPIWLTTPTLPHLQHSGEVAPPRRGPAARVNGTRPMLRTVPICREELWSIRLHDTVLDLCSFEREEDYNIVFAALADGTVAVIEVRPPTSRLPLRLSGACSGQRISSPGCRQCSVQQRMTNEGWGSGSSYRFGPRVRHQLLPTPPPHTHTHTHSHPYPPNGAVQTEWCYRTLPLDRSDPAMGSFVQGWGVCTGGACVKPSPFHAQRSC